MSKAAELAALIGSQTALSPSRNFIINGGMRIAQRGTSLSSITGTSIFLIDRWKIDEVADSTLTMSQETLTSGAAFDAGLNHSLKVLVTTADTSIGSSQSVQLTQPVEAQNLQTLKFGSSGAKNLTLSFYYKSNVTGIHTVCIDKSDTTRATCPIEFTVSSANTWERYILKAVANSAVQASSGAIANDNGQGFRVMWGLAYGSDYQSGTSGTWEQNGTASFSTSNQQNIVGAADNYIEVTGVQLEVGDVATAFEHEDFGTTIAKCQRYYQKTFPYGTAPAQNAGTNGSIVAVSSGTGTAPNRALSYHWAFPVVMRTAPTTTTFNTSATNANWYTMPTGGSVAASILYATDSGINITNNATTTDNYAYRIQATVDAEL